MRGRTYAVPFTNISVSAVQDLFELGAADDKPIEICGIEFSQTGNSDVGDSQEEMLRFSITRGLTSSGSGGSSVTPAPLSPTDQAAGFTAEVNNTTQATTGTEVVLFSGAFNIRAGYLNYFPEDLRPGTKQGELLLVKLGAAPADAVTLSGMLWVRELG